MKKVYWIIGSLVVIGAGVGIYIYYKRKKDAEALAARISSPLIGGTAAIKTDLVNAVAATDVSSDLNIARMAAPIGSDTFGQVPYSEDRKGQVGNLNHGYYKNGVWYWYPKYL